MKITKEDKNAIREAAAMIYAAAECDEMYNKDAFMKNLRTTIANTPIVGGYADSARVLNSLK